MSAMRDRRSLRVHGEDAGAARTGSARAASRAACRAGPSCASGCGTRRQREDAPEAGCAAQRM